LRETGWIYLAEYCDKWWAVWWLYQIQVVLNSVSTALCKVRHAVCGCVGLWSITCWDCGFECCWGHGYLSWVLCVVR